MAHKVDRVLHIAPTPFFADRGCHIRIRGIVLALEEQGVDNLVCTYPIGRDIKGVRTVRTLRIPGYTKTEAGPSAFKYVADILLMFTVARQLRRFRPQILHCHLHEGLLIGWVARLLALKWRVPLVCDVQGGLTAELTSHGYFAGRHRRQKAFEFLERRIVSLASLFYCSSEASVALLTDVFEVEPTKVHLIRDGVDALDTSENRGIEPNVLLEDTELATAIYAGGLTKNKGFGVLQEILLEASRRDLAVRFLVVGYPTRDLERFVRENGLQDNCVLTGQVPYQELRQYLELANIALEPKADGSGEASGKLINYMTASLPVICFNTPNNRDILGENAYFAEDNTAAAFVDQLQLALSSPAEAQERGRAASELAPRRFSWRAGAKTIINTYALVHNSNSGSLDSTFRRP